MISRPIQNDMVSRGLLRRLTGATFNYGLGRILPQVISFLLIPLYTVYLSPKDYGVVELTTVLCGFLVIMMRLGVPGAVTRFYYDHREGAELRDYVTTIARFMIVSSVVVGILTLLATWFFGNVLVPGLPFYPFVLLAVIGSLVASNSDLQRRLIEAREQSAYSARLSIAFSLADIVLTLILVIVFKMGVLGIVLSQVIVDTVFFFQARHYLKPDLQGKFRGDMLRPSMTYAAGVLPSHFMGTLSPLITRFVLAGANSLAAVGILAIASRFTLPLFILLTAFNSAYLPVYFSVRKEGTSESLNRLAMTARNVWTLAVACALVMALIGPPAILLLTNERYHPAAPLLPILTVGFLGQTLYTLLGTEIFYSKKTWLVPFVSGASILATVLVTLLTAKRFGANGVAWATSGGLVAAALVAIVFSIRLVRLPLDWTSLGRTALVGAGLFTIVQLVPGQNVLMRAAIGLSVVVIFPILLWLTSDPSIREGLRLLRYRFFLEKEVTTG
ncbi:MAG: polysaccharide biosynthesis protein [Acidobacteria bacterium]|nr:polysaccharide biosynthesis protein [Acidobacteriota bacterium]